MKRLVSLLLLMVILMSSSREDGFTVFMIGDSTMANKDTTGGKQERGWGMVLQQYFDSKVIVDNHAVNGRSSKSFIDEGRWQKVLDKIRPGDYVFIQFGHNDEKPQPERHTDPGTTFDANLRRFVEETRSKGGIPVLFNAVVRRNFAIRQQKNDDDEKLRNLDAKDAKGVIEGDTLYDTHGDYRVSPMNVARELDVTFIDANAITHELEQGLGREASKKLHMIFAPGETPSLPNGRWDNTHYNIYGANQVALLLIKAVGDKIPQIRSHLVLHGDTVPVKKR
ncbi:MAG: rhamnogalacturonan acetylesterase [Prevotella sp.]|nr:rhamnogalacturonan acetylesterase [Prevotella sp.]